MPRIGGLDAAFEADRKLGILTKRFEPEILGFLRHSEGSGFVTWRTDAPLCDIDPTDIG
jgi:hypothetical protein